MQIVIEIPEGTYDLIKHNVQAQSAFEEAFYAIRRGTVLPKGHGRLIDGDILKNHNHCSESYVRLFTIVEADKEVDDEDSN